MNVGVWIFVGKFAYLGASLCPLFILERSMVIYFFDFIEIFLRYSSCYKNCSIFSSIFYSSIIYLSIGGHEVVGKLCFYNFFALTKGWSNIFGLYSLWTAFFGDVSEGTLIGLDIDGVYGAFAISLF